MLKHVAYVSMFVSNQDKALDFYTNVVGFEKRWDVPAPSGARFLTIGVKGQDVQFLLWQGTPGERALGPGEMTIDVDDCQRAFEALRSRGRKVQPAQRHRDAVCVGCEAPGSSSQSASGATRPPGTCSTLRI